MADIKKGFKKYEYENIRTEYQALNAQYSRNDPIVAGTVIKATRDETDNTKITAIAKAVKDTDTLTDAVMNSTYFLLSEDIVKGDNGFVYYIVENVANLEDRA